MRLIRAPPSPSNTAVAPKVSANRPSVPSSRSSSVVMTCSRPSPRISSYCACERTRWITEIRRFFPIQADVSDPVAVRGMFDAVQARFGGIDVLVNNAGIQNLAPLAEMTDSAFDRMIAINLKGVFNTLREAARRIRPGGRISIFRLDRRRRSHRPMVPTRQPRPRWMS
ncbi:SDR family NAD(P)-dependent oxidoreductase [Trinickia diaoshuihuensis]|uniref:SDR family NAD(P)-dependent oxidoreductase n=1 Tax=Trinickia diaoshuihuensis TaxID=2292265 RepID=UPI0019677ED9